MKLKIIITLLLSINLLHAKEGVPFIHSYGELRVYFQDWLVVCQDKGEGECRMVNYLNQNNQPTGFFPNSRLSIVPMQGSNKLLLDFYQHNAPSTITGISIELGQKRFDFVSSDYKTPKQTRMMETYTIQHQDKLASIIEKSKGARWLTFTYELKNHTQSVKFSLRGFTKALEFIYQQKAHNFR